MFEALGAVDGSQGTEDTQHPEDLDHRDSTGATEQRGVKENQLISYVCRGVYQENFRVSLGLFNLDQLTKR